MGEAKRREESKREAFEANPDRFVDKEDIIIGIVKDRTPDGKIGAGTWINPGISRLLIINALYDIQEQVSTYIRHMDAESLRAKMAKEPQIITPENGGNGKPRIEIP